MNGDLVAGEEEVEVRWVGHEKEWPMVLCISLKGAAVYSSVLFVERYNDIPNSSRVLLDILQDPACSEAVHNHYMELLRLASTNGSQA